MDKFPFYEVFPMSTNMPSITAIARYSIAALGLLSLPVHAQLTPEWISTLPVGGSLSSGIGGYVVDEAGIAYLTGTIASGYGPFGIDVVTAAIGPNGSLLWQTTYDGPENGFDQASAIALGPDGALYVSGDTQGPDFYANVLLLKYDAATGALLDSVVWSTGPTTSEYGGSVAVDALGGVYVVGGTGGDGTDALILKFSAACELQWKRTWDGAAVEPYSLDSALSVLIDPNGDVIVLIHGVTGSNQPDFVVVKYAPATGATIWTASWGDNGGDTPRDIELDAAGDIYVAGTSGFFETAAFSIVRLRNTDGAVLWYAYDTFANHASTRALTLDGQGGVYVTGTVDPDTDESNDNDNIYTFKRSTDGALLWTHLYGGSAKWQRDEPSDVVADPAGHVFVGGYTNSPPYVADTITLVLDAQSGVEVDRHIIPGGPGLTAESGFMAFDANYNLLNGATTLDYDTGGAWISLVKFTTLASTPYQLDLPQFDAGSVATFAVKHATPLQTQFLGYSVTGTAAIPFPVLDVTLGLANPFLLVYGAADGAGSYSVDIPVPAGIGGLTVWFQAVQMSGATPVVKRTIQ
jgi:hypothetical protein